jgi:hypothetical protein
MDVFVYEISTSVYEPYENSLGLLSRVYGNSTGGYMAVEFDDVYMDVAEPAATYNATGDWQITTSNPWAGSGCDLPDVGETSPVTITQNGNDLTMVVHDDEGDITLTGFVYGDTYAFMMTEENIGETEITYGIFRLSQNTSGAGNVTFIWTDGVERCELGFDVTLAKLSSVTVNGTLTLPAEANGKEYIVIVDNDTEGDNGWINATVGTCVSGTTVDYSISNVPAGTYYIYAVVRIVSAHDSPAEDGDYIGFYGSGEAPPENANAIVPDSGTVTFDISLSTYDDSTDDGGGGGGGGGGCFIETLIHQF